MGIEYTNLDKKVEQPPSETIFGIYREIAGAMRKEGIKAKKESNAVIIEIGNPSERSYLSILHNDAEERTEIRYKLSGKLAKELAIGIGRHFPIFEGSDKLAENVKYVEVWTSIRNKETKCESGSKYCRKVSVDIRIGRESYNDPKQDEIQPQQPTELGVELARSSLEELLNLLTNGNISVSVSDDGTTYVTTRNGRPILIDWPPHERGMQSYTVSEKLAKDLIKELGKYIPLPRDLKEANNVRVTWGYTPHGYEIGFDVEMEPRTYIFK